MPTRLSRVDDDWSSSVSDLAYQFIEIDSCFESIFKSIGILMRVRRAPLLSWDREREIYKRHYDYWDQQLGIIAGKFPKVGVNERDELLRIATYFYNFIERILAEAEMDTRLRSDEPERIIMDARSMLEINIEDLRGLVF